MLTSEMSRCVENATYLAARLGRIEVDVGHVVIAILEDKETASSLLSIGAVPAKAAETLRAHHSGEPSEMADAFGVQGGPYPSTDLKTLIRVSFDYVSRRGKQEVSPLAFLRSVMRFNGGVPGQALFGLGITSADIETLINNLDRMATLKAKSLPETILKYCRDLVMEAVEGRIDPVVGREAQVVRCAGILRRRKKNNPILIGEPGVGKTAIVEGLARLIADGRAGPGLNDSRILSLDVAKIIAGTRHRGDLEQRLSDIISNLEEDPSLILFIDETHVIVGGASGMADASNLLKPALASGRIRCIGATTHGEYARYFDSDPALARRFQSVDVPEPSPEEAAAILRNSLPSYASHHGVDYACDAVSAAVGLTVRYVLGRKLPDKALDALDEAGALASMRGDKTADASHVSEVVSRMCGRRLLDGGKSAEVLRRHLTAAVRGQDTACASVARLVSRSMSTLAASEGISASMLMTGGMGSGKKLIARTLGIALELPVHCLDMTEFRQEHTVSRLIGSPPGYVGHGEGGRLTEIVRRAPSCILVLDNMDAAHPDVHSIVTQAMRNGFLTDTSDRIVSFRGVILIMMVRTDGSEGSAFGFTSQTKEMSEEFLSKLFPPSLLDLVDLTIELEPIGRDTLQRIAMDMHDALEQRLSERGIRLTVSRGILDAVVEETIAQGTGARRMHRIFKRMVENPVIDAEAAGSLDGIACWHLSKEGVVSMQTQDQMIEVA